MQFVVTFDDESYYTIELKTAQWCLFIGEPYLYDNDLDKLIDGKKNGGIGGGGNSNWSLHKSNGIYVLEFYISGLGDDASFTMPIDTSVVEDLVRVMKDLAEFKKTGKQSNEYTGLVGLETIVKAW
jgi:hypothetical protein